ncbi:DUF5828 family protein [Halosolutus gelatinilyticus]|uniref:DUF5828 family protein n=1 Tax=Halosolutus gelatinilyticus TaxID=2931975 RepID=UPI001FF3886D|nr:DUF5828 family protein [Halosolutus gelatinilyticus]
MEESISGFKVEGDWGAIVEHGERITQALRELGVQSDDGDDDRSRFAADLDEWDEWRPKAHESFERDVTEKTAEQASVGEGEGEREGAEPEEDLQTAGEKLSESVTALEERDVDEAVESGTEAIDRATRAADSVGRKALRTVEKGVYRHVMTQLAPCYFDNELVSANVQRPLTEDGDRFSFEVNVNDDQLKAEVSDLLARYEDEVDRWHVDTEKDTTIHETVEGAEVPPEPGDQSRSTIT